MKEWQRTELVAIDIGTNAAKIVQLEQSFSTTVHLTNANVVTYPDKDDRLQVYESVKHLWDSLGDLPVESGIRSLFNRNKTEIAACPSPFPSEYQTLIQFAGGNG